jgi:hypothetical protein
VYCEKCNKLVPYSTEIETQDLTVREFQIQVPQFVSRCAICGEEVNPSVLMDFNIARAHCDYLRAKRKAEFCHQVDINAQCEMFRFHPESVQY